MDLPIWVLFGAAVLVVLATSLFKHVDWGQKVKAIVATVVAVVAAGIATWAAGDFNAQSLWEASLAMFGLSQGFYQLIFKGTKPEDALARTGTSRSTNTSVKTPPRA